jgi:hypothetical protein
MKPGKFCTERYISRTESWFALRRRWGGCLIATDDLGIVAAYC